MDDVIINKAVSIERCINRIQEDYLGSEDELENNFTKQDAIILNLQRACQTAIDMGTHIVRIKRMGVPQSSREVFGMLAQAGFISTPLSKKLQAMVGFRNIAIHDYSAINLDIVRSIIENNLEDFTEYTSFLLNIEEEDNDT